MVKEGLVTKEEALLQIDPKLLDSLLHPTFDEKALKSATPVTKGLPASSCQISVINSSVTKWKTKYVIANKMSEIIKEYKDNFNSFCLFIIILQ